MLIPVFLTLIVWDIIRVIIRSKENVENEEIPIQLEHFTSYTENDEPPSYSETQSNEPPPPNYKEAISRIRKQLPILSRSISETAQRINNLVHANHSYEVLVL